MLSKDAKEKKLDKDPVEFCGHIPAQVKKTQQRLAKETIEKNLTREQIKEEQDVQRKQLEEIFKLMEKDQDRFGVGSIEDMRNQMSLYM